MLLLPICLLICILFYIVSYHMHSCVSSVLYYYVHCYFTCIPSCEAYTMSKKLWVVFFYFAPSLTVPKVPEISPKFFPECFFHRSPSLDFEVF